MSVFNSVCLFFFRLYMLPLSFFFNMYHLYLHLSMNKHVINKIFIHSYYYYTTTSTTTTGTTTTTTTTNITFLSLALY